MKVRKITALVVGAAMLGAVAAAGTVSAQKVEAPNGIPQMKINSVDVVLPTTPEVNGIPLHIKNDAAAAVMLVTDIYQDSVLMDINDVQKALTPVDVGGEVSNYVKDTDSVIGINSTTTGDGTTNPDIDIDYAWYVPNLDIPMQALTDSYYDTSGNPLDVVGFGVDFSKISWVDPSSTTLTAPEQDHKGEWELTDGAIKLGWALEWSPLKPNAEDTVVLSTQTDASGATINVIYYYKNYVPSSVQPAQVDLNTVVKAADWQVEPLDINTTNTEALVKIIGPKGSTLIIAAPLDQTNPYHYVFWVNAQGDLVYWTDNPNDTGGTLDIDGDGTPDITATTVDGVIQQLEEAGVGTLMEFTPYSGFVGVNGTKQLSMSMDAKVLKDTYKDGEKVVDIFPEFKQYPHAENWYLQIDPNSGEPIVYFVWKSEYDPNADDYAAFPPVFFQPGDKLYIPVPYFKNVGTSDNPEYELTTEVITLEMTAQLDSAGEYWDPTTAEFYIEYYKNTGKYYSGSAVDNQLEELMNQIQASDPTQALVTDESVLQNGFQAGKDYIIIGGWVSNKAWQELEKYYPEKVAEMKQYLLNEINQGQGDYIVYVLPNPADNNHVIIVAAGTDHEQTYKAIEYVMKNMGQH